MRGRNLLHVLLLYDVVIRVFIVWADFGIPRRSIFQIRTRVVLFDLLHRIRVLASRFNNRERFSCNESSDGYHATRGVVHNQIGHKVHAVIKTIFRRRIATFAHIGKSTTERLVAPTIRSFPTASRRRSSGRDEPTANDDASSTL